MELGLGKWKGLASVRDGSVKGFELNCPPTNGDLFVERIEELTKILRYNNVPVKTNCGYHVHVNGSDLAYEDIRTLIDVYRRIESAVFECLPPSRKANQFVTKVGDRYKVEVPEASGAALGKAIKTKLYGNPNHRPGKYGHYHYFAMNLNSWFFRGTVEFRHAAGTKDKDKIVMWATYWAAVVDRCKKERGDLLAALPEKPLDALLYLCPTDEHKEWFQSRWDKFHDKPAHVPDKDYE